MKPMTTSARVLVVALLALAAVFFAWFRSDRSPMPELLVFAAPPLALAYARLRGMPSAGFWASVLALGWFSHGVMVAWSRPAEAVWACVEVLLALVVIFSAAVPALKARAAAKRARKAGD